MPVGNVEYTTRGSGMNGCRVEGACDVVFVHQGATIQTGPDRYKAPARKRVEQASIVTLHPWSIHRSQTQHGAKRRAIAPLRLEHDRLGAKL